MMKQVMHTLASAAILLGAVFGADAQNSLPAPGSGGSYTPNMGGSWGGSWGGYNPIYNPAPAPPYWGSPWYAGWNYNPTVVLAPTVSAPDFTQQGTTKVIACGYDATGVWRVIPLKVSYVYNGAQYNVYVLNAWNPWTDQWDQGVDVKAYHTDYTLRDVNYDFYVVLSTGTFYFNL